MVRKEEVRFGFELCDAGKLQWLLAVGVWLLQKQSGNLDRAEELLELHIWQQGGWVSLI